MVQLSVTKVKEAKFGLDLKCLFRPNANLFISCSPYLSDSFIVRVGDIVLSRVLSISTNVILDPNLSWNNHIDYIGRKYRQSSACFVKRERSFRVIRA